MFKGKTLLVTGGTGSFGNAIVQRFLKSDIKEIRILSRDEKKQEDMRKRYNDDKLKFYIGDVRDYRSIEGAFIGVLGSIVPILLISFGYAQVYYFFTKSMMATASYELVSPTTLVLQLNSLLVVIGVVIGSFGSVISMRRFLKI